MRRAGTGLSCVVVRRSILGFRSPSTPSYNSRFSFASVSGFKLPSARDTQVDGTVSALALEDIYNGMQSTVVRRREFRR